MEGIIAESYSTDAAGDGALPGAQAFGRKPELGFGASNSNDEEKRELGSRTPDASEGRQCGAEKVKICSPLRLVLVS